MRVVEIEDQRLTVYIAEGLLDRLALLRIPGLQRGYIPILDDMVRVRTWDGRARPVFFRKPHMDDRF